MTDLDARVAALMALADKYYTTNTLSGFDFKQAIRAELQKPALHAPVSDQETIDAIRAHHLKVTTKSMIDMRRTLESFLQGRAKPAQEEITDAEILLPKPDCPNIWGGCYSEKLVREIIRASKGEKT